MIFTLKFEKVLFKVTKMNKNLCYHSEVYYKSNVKLKMMKNF